MSQSGLNHIWLPYTQMKTSTPPLKVSHTKGSHIYLCDGRVLIDGIASWWTACHGYNHPYIQQAAQKQLALMPHVMFGGLVHEPALKLAERLSNLLPGDLERVFFTDSGSVAVEVAMKMAMQYWINQNNRKKTKLLAFQGGYHGDTLATMSVCDPEEGMHHLFSGILPENYVIPLPTNHLACQNFENFLEHHHQEIAAILIEPLVQGAGGMLFHDPELLIYLRKQADRFSILLIFDEIFTGFGRTGSLFACQQANVTPDIITLSKALTGGTMALAATVARRHVFEKYLSDNAEHALMHGPTFMANPLACACANASLDLFEQTPYKEKVKNIEIQLKESLNPCRNFHNVKDVRVKGGIGVVELNSIDHLEYLKQLLLQQNVWIRPFRNIVYLTPAFTISQEELSQLTQAIVKVLYKDH